MAKRASERAVESLSPPLLRLKFPILKNQGVHNLSTKQFTADQSYLLSLGFKFIPPPPINHQLLSDLMHSHSQFCRSLRLRKHFALSDTIMSPLHVRNPTWQPPPGPSYLEKYLVSTGGSLYSKAEKFLATHTSNNDVSQWFSRTIKSILADTDITIRPSDKGFETLVLNIEDYHKYCLLHLCDRTTYSLLDEVPNFVSIWARLHNILHKHGFDTRSSVSKFLTQLQHTAQLRLAKFYCLIKLHKTPIVGRPIASCLNTATFYASKYLDRELQAFLQRIPSYLLSSQQLVVELSEKTFPSNSVLVAADVSSLYPNIPINEGLQALHSQLIAYGLLPSKVNFFVDLAAWILRNNFLTYRGQTYLQISGTAMGTPFAVVFANLFLGHLELKLSCREDINQPIFFRRYIDDLFLVFSSAEDAHHFIATYNSFYPSIKLTAKIGHSVEFMDLRISTEPLFSNSRLLETELYTAPTHKFLYLPLWSYHPRAIFPAFILAERRRIRLNCSNDSKFLNHDRRFYDRLRDRGYDTDFLDPLFNRALDRRLILRRARHSINTRQFRKRARSLNPLVFKVKLSPLVEYLQPRRILRLPERLRDDPQANFMFTRRCPIMCHPRNKNLGDIFKVTSALPVLNSTGD